MKKLTIWTLLFLISTLFTGTALAERVLTIKNNTGYTINVALRYHDSEYNDWLTLGWVVVRSGQSEKLAVDTNNGTLYFYGHAHNHKYFWGGTYNDRNDRKYWVRDAQMMIRGQGRITGRNQRRVWFNHLSADQDGNFYIRLN